MMRVPPMTRRHTVNKELISRTLPDQFPDVYYGSLATVLQIHRPEEVWSPSAFAVFVGSFYFYEIRATTTCIIRWDDVIGSVSTL